MCGRIEVEDVDLSASPTRKKQSKMGEKKCRRAEFRDSGGGEKRRKSTQRLVREELYGVFGQV